MHAFTSQNKCTTTQNKHKKKLNPGLVTSYDIWPGNGEGIFWFLHFIQLSLTKALTHLLTDLPTRDKVRPICNALLNTLIDSPTAPAV